MLQASTSEPRITGLLCPPGRDREGQDVRRFEAFSGDLCALADWLRQCGIETVAMESTGVYWIALYVSGDRVRSSPLLVLASLDDSVGVE
jgi:hypothetical protein